MFREQVTPFPCAGDLPPLPDLSSSRRFPVLLTVGTCKLIGVRGFVQYDFIHMEPGNTHPFDRAFQAFDFFLVHGGLPSLDSGGEWQNQAQL